MAPPPKEIVLECCDGIKLAAQKWEVKSTSSSSNGSGGGFSHHPYGNMMLISANGGGYGGIISGGSDGDGPVATTKKTRILCVHGLFDNCRSFHYLGPNLVDKLLSKQSSGYTNDTYQIELVAIDLPGHGKSTNRSLDVAGTTYLENIFYIAEAIKQLKWDKDEKVTIIGHSFGGSLVLAYAATFPERVEKIVLLDRATPKFLPVSTTVTNMRDHVTRRQLSANSSQTKRMLYDTLQGAIDSRVKAAASLPGKQTISVEAATQLVERGTRKIAGGYQFSQDIRLDWPLFLELSLEQVAVINYAVKCPIAKLFAENGWPYPAEYIAKEDESLRPVVNQVLPGSHHFHADPTTSKAVVEEIVKFMAPK